jgi:hypothetical protein
MTTVKQIRVLKALRSKTVANGCTEAEAAAASAKADALEAKYGIPRASSFQPMFYPFRQGTKRRACFDLLNREQGATLFEGVAATGWAQNVVLSEYHELAKACGATVVRKGVYYHLEGGRRTQH